MTTDLDEVLASAWRAPSGSTVVVVLMNSGLTEQGARIDLGGAPARASAMTRTVLEGVERSAELGGVPADGVVRLPPRSLATVVFER